MLSNGQQVHLVFKPQNFAHLAGLRKVKDLHEFQMQTSAVNLYKRILRGEICLHDLQRSVHFDRDAYERIENLSRLHYVLNQPGGNDLNISTKNEIKKRAMRRRCSAWLAF